MLTGIPSRIQAANSCIYTLHGRQPELLPHFAGVIGHLQSLDPIPTHTLGLSISIANRCLFCADVHEAFLYASGHGRTARAIRSGESPDAATRDAALTFHYLNRISNVFLRRTALPFSNPTLRALYLRALSIGSAAPAQGPPMQSAILSLCHAADTLGNRVLPEPIRTRVQTHVQAWTGEDMGPNRSWVENYLADFSPRDRAVGRLALLAALASHQVDEVVIGSLQPADDGHLLAVVAWSAAQAVLHMYYGVLTECAL